METVGRQRARKPSNRKKKGKKSDMRDSAFFSVDRFLSHCDVQTSRAQLCEAKSSWDGDESLCQCPGDWKNTQAGDQVMAAMTEK